MMDRDRCIFCRIIFGLTDASWVYSDDQVIAIQDINPITPVHLLIIPRKHISSMNEVSEEDQSLLGHMFVVASNLAAEMRVNTSGYRLVINSGQDAGQSVFHLHIHVLGGRRMPFSFND